MPHMSDAHDRTFQMRVTKAFMALVDDWRRQQPSPPSRAEAIRHLVTFGYAAWKPDVSEAERQSANESLRGL
jgi:hypothetical protein